MRRSRSTGTIPQRLGVQNPHYAAIPGQQMNGFVSRPLGVNAAGVNKTPQHTLQSSQRYAPPPSTNQVSNQQTRQQISMDNISSSPVSPNIPSGIGTPPVHGTISPIPDGNYDTGMALNPGPYRLNTENYNQPNLLRNAVPVSGVNNNNRFLRRDSDSSNYLSTTPNTPTAFQKQMIPQQHYNQQRALPPSVQFFNFQGTPNSYVAQPAAHEYLKNRTMPVNTPTTNDGESKASPSDHRTRALPPDYERQEIGSPKSIKSADTAFPIDFSVDASCLGFKSIYGEDTGFIRSDRDPLLYQKYGSATSLLISSRCVTNGKFFWEFECIIENNRDTVPFCVGAIPRTLETRIDVNKSITQNSGFSQTLEFGTPDGVKQNDRIGIYLLCSENDYATMFFFRNAQFDNILSIKNIPTNASLFPAISVAGDESASIKFRIVQRPVVPDLNAHQMKEREFVELRDRIMRMRNFKKGNEYNQILKENIANAHRGGTIEISAQLTEDLKLKVGDAILFVEQHEKPDYSWEFNISDDRIFAQDHFYHHQEFDLHGPGTGHALKVAYKFIALASGFVQFKSSYVEEQSAPFWRQNLVIEVMPEDADTQLIQ